MKFIGASPWGSSGDDRKRKVRYRARFWEGPCESGQTGRYVETECHDVLVEQWRLDAEGKRYRHRHFLNTAPSVSYYADLMRQALKG